MMKIYEQLLFYKGFYVFVSQFQPALSHQALQVPCSDLGVMWM